MNSNQSFCFTDDTRRYLKTELGQYDVDKVEKFISDLEKDCIVMNQIVKNPKPKKKKKQTKDILKSCKGTLEYLERIRKFKIPIDTLEKIPTKDIDEHLELSDFLFNSWFLAVDAIKPLKKFTELLEKILADSKKPKGRPPADYHNFVGSVAVLFNDHIAKPTKSQKKGSFFNVVSITLEALGLPSDNPSRSIKKALERFQS